MDAKYVVILGDGMSDYPVAELNGLTPLMAARKPNMDFIAREGEIGLAKTAPDNLPPGSDTANMSCLGFDPNLYYTGRSPIEAVSMGVDLGDLDVAFRCNLVTLSDDGEAFLDKIMQDHSSGEIGSDEAAVLIKDVGEKLAAIGLCDDLKLYAGISYRHCMVWNNRGAGVLCEPPHDILERRVKDYLPRPKSEKDKDDARAINKIMQASFDFLNAHPINVARAKNGLNKANSLWLWGQGGRLTMPSFKEQYGVLGAVVSAVDLIKGIGISAGLESIDVPGATGTIDTNYEGKAAAAIDALRRGNSFVYVHVEAPDECGHRHEIENKVRSIELLDARLVAPILKALDREYEDYSVMVMPDHPTPLALRTHSHDPVPYAIYRKKADYMKPRRRAAGYDEQEAKRSGVMIDPGWQLMKNFIR